MCVCVYSTLLESESESKIKSDVNRVNMCVISEFTGYLGEIRNVRNINISSYGVWR